VAAFYAIVGNASTKDKNPEVWVFSCFSFLKSVENKLEVKSVREFALRFKVYKDQQLYSGIVS